MVDTLGANECPVCRFDHLSLPVTVVCPDHGHRLITASGRMTCPGHRCRYWRPIPDDEQKPGTVSDSQLTALAAQGVTGQERLALSYSEAGAILVKLWRQAAGEMRQHLEARP